MSSGRPEINLFGLVLRFDVCRDDLVYVSGAYGRGGVHALVTLYLRSEDLQALLEQIERQYQDFGEPVRWKAGVGESYVAYDWRLDQRGHASGRFELCGGRWTLAGDVDGDQSYLPQIALGLRLMLRECGAT